MIWASISPLLLKSSIKRVVKSIRTRALQDSQKAWNKQDVQWVQLEGALVGNLRFICRLFKQPINLVPHSSDITIKSCLQLIALLYLALISLDKRVSPSGRVRSASFYGVAQVWDSGTGFTERRKELQTILQINVDEVRTVCCIRFDSVAGSRFSLS
jgi:hypothetical protein